MNYIQLFCVDKISVPYIIFVVVALMHGGVGGTFLIHLNARPRC